VDEGAESYFENAALKARALYAQLRAVGIEANVIGDDSGLEVLALGNRPGVLSARYGGDASWAQRRALLLTELGDLSDRRARFVCALHYIDFEGRETSVCAELAGVIPLDERGDGGFSYDAIFSEVPGGPTFGELSEEQKNERSHRARAATLLVEAVRADEAKTARTGT
jgi:XTP/dITP diphosphohydrolase